MSTDLPSPVNTAERRPRFKRQAPASMRVTDDDVAIIRHVGEHRFLRSTHLVKLLGRSQEKTVRRLGTLYHNGYLDRPRAQLDFFSRSGSAPMIYGLGNAGAALLSEIDGTPAPKVDWTDKNRDAGRPYIEHALMIADLMVDMEIACRQHPTIRLMSAKSILARAPEMTRMLDFPWSLTATVPAGHGIAEIAVYPDKVFGLDFTDIKARYYFLVEADRSTMPIERRDLAQSSFKKKLLAYHHASLAKQHVERWGIPGFRVLTVTKSAERIASMIDVVRGMTNGKGSNVFLFANAADFALFDPLTLRWTTAKTSPVRIADGSRSPDNISTLTINPLQSSF